MKNYKHKNATLTDFQTQVVIGSLLGDMSASIPINGANYHLSCYHSKRQLDWLKVKWQWLQPHSRPIQFTNYLDKRNNKRYPGGRFHTISAPCFTNIAEIFYIDGRKTITDEIFNVMSGPIALACLICDDGSWDKAGIQIASKQFTLDENELLASGLSHIYGIDVTVLKNGGYYSIRIPAGSVEKTYGICSDHIPETMKYKFGGGDYKTALIGKEEIVCPVCNRVFTAYKSAKKVYCGRKCAVIGRPSGYQTRLKKSVCPRCKTEFLRYSKRQKTCTDCRGKPFPGEICKVCGNPVKSHGRDQCSIRCGVIAGHISRGHNIHTHPPE